MELSRVRRLGNACCEGASSFLPKAAIVSLAETHYSVEAGQSDCGFRLARQRPLRERSLCHRDDLR